MSATVDAHPIPQNDAYPLSTRPKIVQTAHGAQPEAAEQNHIAIAQTVSVQFGDVRGSSARIQVIRPPAGGKDSPIRHRMADKIQIKTVHWDKHSIRALDPIAFTLTRSLIGRPSV